MMFSGGFDPENYTASGMPEGVVALSMEGQKLQKYERKERTPARIPYRRHREVLS
jgi:hypothetical protein